MRRLVLFIFLAACALPRIGMAAGCGDEATPCTVADGVYHFAAPEQASADRPAIIFLHGFGGTGKGVIRNKGLLGPILARGYAVVAPQGLPWREGAKGGSWNSMARPSRRDDVAFLQAIADDVAQRHGIDRANILITGFSGGGMMTWRVACDAPDSFRAYAPIAGLLWQPLPDACEGPVKMHHTHGWSDTVVPIEGRSVAEGRFTQGDLFKGLDIIRDANGCAKDDPDEYAESDTHLIRRWTSCDDTSALSLALHPGGHSIPKGWADMAMDWFEGLP